VKNYLSLLLIGFLFTGLAKAQEDSNGDSASTYKPPAPKADVTPIEDTQYFNNNLLDTLHFRVPKGDVLLEVRFGTSLNDYSNLLYQGQNSYNHSKSWSDAYVDVNYGISDNFLIGVSDKGTTSTDAQQNVNGGNSTYANSGWSDPNLFANFRFLGGLNNDHFASVGLAFSPSMGTAVGATSSSNGNELRGDSLASELSAKAAINYQMAGAYQNAAGKNGYTWSPYATYDLSGNYRYHISSKYFVGTGLVYNLPYQVFASRNDGASQWVTSDDANLSPHLQVGWKITNNLVAKLDYYYSSNSYTTNYSSGTQASGSGGQQYMHVGLDSQF
jgi:hypothetical protein